MTGLRALSFIFRMVKLLPLCVTLGHICVSSLKLVGPVGRFRHLQLHQSEPSRPPIIPYDDFTANPPVQPQVKDPPPRLVETVRLADKRVKQSLVNPSGWIEDPNRPTGYGRPDLDDNEEEMMQKMIDEQWTPPADETEFQRWFRNTYIGSPYDSRKKQQARYVIRNITVICFSIAAIFTGIWYAFPNKFISVRGDRDFTERYQTDFVPPEGLLSEDWSKSKITSSEQNQFFDNYVPLPQPQTRFPIEQSDNKGLKFAPPPRVDL